MPECMQCHRALQSVEIALTKKLINRGATRFLCLNCLGKKFGVSEETLLQKAKEFREMGCTLFGCWRYFLHGTICVDGKNQAGDAGGI